MLREFSDQGTQELLKDPFLQSLSDQVTDMLKHDPEDPTHKQKMLDIMKKFDEAKEEYGDFFIEKPIGETGEKVIILNADIPDYTLPNHRDSITGTVVITSKGISVVAEVQTVDAFKDRYGVVNFFKNPKIPITSMAPNSHLGDRQTLHATELKGPYKGIDVWFALWNEDEGGDMSQKVVRALEQSIQEAKKIKKAV